MVYRNKYHVDIRTTTTKVYEDLRNGKISKFPKGFFLDGWQGKAKACVCLQYALSMHSFSSIEEIYRIFADKNIFRVLSKWRLDAVCKTLYQTPIEYLHNALPTKQRDEELYKQYSEVYNEFLKKSGRKY
jgi:hypothetical protein